MPESDRIILPFHNVVYTLSEQEADALEWHCQREHFEECQVTAISIEKKKAKGRKPEETKGQLKDEQTDMETRQYVIPSTSSNG